MHGALFSRLSGNTSLTDTRWRGAAAIVAKLAANGSGYSDSNGSGRGR
jgi:hypothetical protein